MNAFDQQTADMGANLLTPAEFAKEKNTSRASVTRHIAAGKIIPKYVGKYLHPFIDGKKYSNYTFDDSRTNKRYLQ